MHSINEYIKNLVLSWKEALADKVFFYKLILAPGLFLLYSAVTQPIGSYVEGRKGIILHDALLNLIPQYDFSVWVFVVLYGSLLLLVVTHFNQPRVILKVIEMHFLIAVVRQICILLIALEPPQGIIILRDVFLENTVYPRESPLTKDLFFSGHVASVWLYFLAAEKKWIKRLFIISTILMCCMILSMRVHYSYDVYGAFLFTTVLFYAPYWYKNKILAKQQS